MIYATASDEAEAKTLAEILVNERLVACVNIIQNATSVYRWNDKIESAKETILIAKTTLGQRDAAMSRLKDCHSYDIPCVVSYDMSGGLPAYLSWIVEQTQ
ncbi:MAG: divalent-cation tolerance protein CutA [Rhodospirillaceae bacterium]